MNGRRRVRRWVGSLPNGQDHPAVYLRLGNRTRKGEERPYDFLDVVAPLWPKVSPTDLGIEIADAYTTAFGRQETVVQCSHDAPTWPGALASIALYRDGRRARYLSEVRF